MSANHASSTPSLTWRQIARLVAIKTKDDLDLRVRPAVEESRRRLGTWLVNLGQKVLADRQ